MLTRLGLRDFKSFRDQEVDLAPTTLLVGANASGKSNFLDAIRFIQGLSQGLPIPEILRGRYEGGRPVWPGLRGGIAEATRGTGTRFGMTSQWMSTWDPLSHRVDIDITPEPMIARESLYHQDWMVFDTHADTLGQSAGRGDGGNIRVAVKGSGPGRSPWKDCSASRSALVQLDSVERMANLVPELVDAFRTAVRGAILLDVRPAQMRGYVPKRIGSIGANGENVSAAIWRLAQDPNRKQDLVDWLSALCSPSVVDIEFDETKLDEVMMMLVETDGTRVSARSLSDGTLRFLGILAALLTSEPGSVLLIEEIENGLHPARIHLLVELIEHVTRDRSRQVIATTHSPLALRALSPQGLHAAIVFGRRPDDPGTMIRRLGDLADFDEVEGRRGVDHLFTTQWLERSL